MKNILTLIITLLISTSTFAQQGINYKALIKDDQGNVVANEDINIQFSILDALSGGTIEFQEIHYNAMTDANGIVIVNIGEGAQSLSYGFFNDIDWESQAHFLRVEIDITGGTNFTDMGITEFLAVPYAKHAETAKNVTGLEKITQNGNTGWRLIDRVQSRYEPIGFSAVDLSYSFGNGSDLFGASGNYSLATGRNTEAIGSSSSALGYWTIASGNTSTAMGYRTAAVGTRSTAMGYRTTARSYAEVAVGSYNTNYTPMNSLDWAINDRIFVIGNGQSAYSKSDALTVLKSGIITAPSLSIAEIDSTGDKALITKEYADDSYLNSSSNLIPIAYGTVESTGSVRSGTGNFTASLNAGVLSISVNGETMTVDNSSCVITPYSTAFRTSSFIMSGGNIDVRIFDNSGNLNPTTFQFTIYKL